MRVLVYAVAIVLALPASGCLVSESAVRPPASVGPDSLGVRVLRDSLARAPSAAARRAVAVRALRAAGVTPLAGDLFTTGVRAPLVGGFVPGRVPGRASELVVVGASLDAASAADVVEAARALVDLSLVQTTPERTVQVVLWTGALETPEALALALRSPLWPRDGLAAAVVVGDAAALPDSVGGVAVAAVPADRPALAARLLDAVLARASEPAVVPTAPRP